MFSDIKYYLKISFPSLTIFFLIFFNLFFANNFFDFGQLFILHAIFFWLLNFPKLIPFYIILIASLVQDIIYLSPLGSTPLVFFLLIFLFEKYNKFFLEPSFIELFFSFVALFTIGMFIFWGINSIFNLKPLLINIDFLYKIFLNTIFFPIHYFFLNIIFKKMNLNKKL
ncbi:MAG: hypothetical protein CFH26_00041 [Alphaproteobacteria bacterium MarineAlpha6_Bin4]|nr:MAG: hypothetical protein CFH26_00041 [Alphaproteobacteria bacterium MarineAlpha6_Bin4]|tara:strand:- start:3009 stop:3515 length:507 start_codon:yes stop_codon:yes gene_type:complete